MKRTLVALVVGLTKAHIGDDTPAIRALAERGWAAPVTPVLPAVTCSAQATYVTGLPPQGHGVVGNGWYWRERAEVAFWKQSNALMQGPRLWDLARDRDAETHGGHKAHQCPQGDRRGFFNAGRTQEAMLRRILVIHLRISHIV